MPRLRPRAFEPTTSRTTSYREGTDKTLAPSSDPVGGSSGGKGGEALAKIIALIPAESITAYQTIFTFTDEGKRPLFGPAVWLILLATPAWNLVATKEKNEPVAWEQVIVSVPAFLVWLVALQSPFMHLPPDWKASDSGVVLALGTLLLPLIGWGLKLVVAKMTKS